jgi:hypothetical protein
MPERRSPATGLERAQRTLAVMAATVIGLTALAIAVRLVLLALGVPQTSFRSGGLQLLAVLPLPGLIIGLLLIFAVVAVSLVSRTRSQRP